MAYKLFLFILIAVCIAIGQSKPVEESKGVQVEPEEEMMETAAAQNPFLPRFTMKLLKERRQQAQAQRRDNAQARGLQRRPCPQYRYYGVSKLTRVVPGLEQHLSVSSVNVARSD